ncbi:MAG: HDOD domain-containing protein [Actinomycetota bacterium]|nr:HDOD domain-containing protein [Actinomycetota bacterium]
MTGATPARPGPTPAMIQAQTTAALFDDRAGPETRPAPASDLLLARQPIFDRDLAVWGYEVLFRDQAGERYTGDAMTAEVLLRTGLDVGIESLVGRRKACINVTRAYLTGEREFPLPHDQVVLEIHPSVERNDDLIGGARTLSSSGYLLALDNYVYRPGDEPLLELVNMVKIDLSAAGIPKLPEQVERCCRYGAHLVAVKVETSEQLVAARDAGFNMFQGHFLSRPIGIPGQTLSPNRMSCLRLIQALSEPDIPASDVQRIIETDPGLSVRFLRAAGAGAASGLRRRLNSIREGVVLMGEQRMKAWVMLMLLADAGGGVPEQLSIAMTRARLCELIARDIRPQLEHPAFTVGLVSALNLLLEVPTEEILANLSLTAELKAAVLDGEGRYGYILGDVLAWEQGLAIQLKSGLSAPRLNELGIEAITWANIVCASLDDD